MYISLYVKVLMTVNSLVRINRRISLKVMVEIANLLNIIPEALMKKALTVHFKFSISLFFFLNATSFNQSDTAVTYVQSNFDLSSVFFFFLEKDVWL